METDELLTILNRQITFLTGGEFEHWKRLELDDRAANYLGRAIQAARKMTPDSAYEAAHYLLMYATLQEMGNGHIAEAVSTRDQLSELNPPALG